MTVDALPILHIIVIVIIIAISISCSLLLQLFYLDRLLEQGESFTVFAVRPRVHHPARLLSIMVHQEQLCLLLLLLLTLDEPIVALLGGSTLRKWLFLESVAALGFVIVIFDDAWVLGEHSHHAV